MANNILILSSVAILVATALAYAALRYRRRQPKSPRTVGKVSCIKLYPIKSGPALVLSSGECTSTGLRYKNVRDRQFVLVGGEKGYITYRTNLKLLNLQLEYEESNDCLVLKAASMTSDLIIPLQVPEYDPSQVKSITWFDGRETSYYDYGTDYTTWLTEFLGQKCALGYSHPGITRQINPLMTYSKEPVHPESKVRIYSRRGAY